MADQRESLQIRRHKQLARVGEFLRLDSFEVVYRFLDADGNPVEQILPRVNVHRGDAVSGLLHYKSTNEIRLVDQFRFSTLLDPASGLPDLARFHQQRTYDGDGRFIELMAGNIMPGEPARVAFRRETFEETGYQLEEDRFIASFYPSPGACSERIHLYYGRIDEAKGRDETKHFGVDDEYIRDVRVSPQRFLDMIVKNEIKDAKAYAAAEWMRRAENRELFGFQP